MTKVVFTEPAESDLLSIEYYIFVELCDPQASQKVISGILNTVEKLGEFPTIHQFVADEFLKSMGLRMSHFDNYNIFYYYDEESDVVFIIRVLYNRADWQNILKK